MSQWIDLQQLPLPKVSYLHSISRQQQTNLPTTNHSPTSTEKNNQLHQKSTITKLSIPSTINQTCNHLRASPCTLWEANGAQPRRLQGRQTLECWLDGIMFRYYDFLMLYCFVLTCFLTFHHIFLYASCFNIIIMPGILRYFAELNRHQVEKLEELYRLDLLLFGYSSQVANLSI